MYIYIQINITLSLYIYIYGYSIFPTLKQKNLGHKQEPKLDDNQRHLATTQRQWIEQLLGPLLTLKLLSLMMTMMMTMMMMNMMMLMMIIAPILALKTTPCRSQTSHFLEIHAGNLLETPPKMACCYLLSQLLCLVFFPTC